MEKKKVISLILAGSIFATLFSGCAAKGVGENPSDKNGGGRTAEQEAEQKEGEGNSKVKLTALISKSGLTKDVNELKWLSDLEEETGVEIEWQQITADWDQKRALCLPAERSLICFLLRLRIPTTYNITDCLRI